MKFPRAQFLTIIVQYLVDHGARLDAKTRSGWTPLMLAGGVFFANAKKEFPVAAAILKKAMAEQGLMPAASARVGAEASR